VVSSSGKIHIRTDVEDRHFEERHSIGFGYEPGDRLLLTSGASLSPFRRPANTM
jgi:hypothetical protein